jgi:hypothetical protein
MKPLSARARLQLERYRAAESIPHRDRERLLANILQAGASGVEPRFEVSTTTPVAPVAPWSARVWSRPIGKFAVAVALLALPVFAVAGVVGRSSRVQVPSARATVPAAPAAPKKAAAPADDASSSPVMSPGAEDVRSPELAKQPTHPAKAGIQASPRDANEPTIDGEMRLLNEAQAANQAGDSRRALSLLDAYATRFPAGHLSDVRTVTRLVALCQLGQVNLARQEADRFRARHPDSPFNDRVKGICAPKASP